MKRLLLGALCVMSMSMCGCWNNNKVDKGVLADNQALTIFVDSVETRTYIMRQGNETYVRYEISKKEAKVWFTSYYSKQSGVDYYKGSVSYSITYKY